MPRQMSTVHAHGPLTSVQLSAETWPDFDRLFAANGGVWGGCWCMFFHSDGEFDPKAYGGNRKAKRSLVAAGKAHGTIVFCGKDPIGWCQFGPKEELPRIDRKHAYTPTAPDAWRITCLFVSPRHRRAGVARLAVKDSVLAMRKLGVKGIEAYPVRGVQSATLLWSGTPYLFEVEGFSRVAPLGKSSWIYSLKLSKQ